MKQPLLSGKTAEQIQAAAERWFAMEQMPMMRWLGRAGFDPAARNLRGIDEDYRHLTVDFWSKTEGRVPQHPEYTEVMSLLTELVDIVRSQHDPSAPIDGTHFELLIRRRMRMCDTRETVDKAIYHALQNVLVRARQPQDQVPA